MYLQHVHTVTLKVGAWDGEARLGVGGRRLCSDPAVGGGRGGRVVMAVEGRKRKFWHRRQARAGGGVGAVADRAATSDGRGYCQT